MDEPDEKWADLLRKIGLPCLPHQVIGKLVMVLPNSLPARILTPILSINLGAHPESIELVLNCRFLEKQVLYKTFCARTLVLIEYKILDGQWTGYFNCTDSMHVQGWPVKVSFP